MYFASQSKSASQNTVDQTPLKPKVGKMLSICTALLSNQSSKCPNGSDVEDFKINTFNPFKCSMQHIRVGPSDGQ